MLMLALDVLVVLAAPLLDRALGERGAAGVLLHDLARVAVAGTVLLHVLPHGLAEHGALAAAAFAAGFVLSVGVERVAAGRSAAALLAVAALVVHHLLDGAALAIGDEHLGPAVVLHTLPVALVAWRLGRARFGTAAGLAVLGLMIAATIVGFVASGQVAWGGGELVGVGLAGGLVHVLGHRLDDAALRDPRLRRASGVGAALGLAVLGLTLWAEPIAARSAGEAAVLPALLGLTTTMAPGLLAGFLVAGALHAGVVPTQAGGGRVGEAVFGAVRSVSACACGTLPTYTREADPGPPTVGGVSLLVAGPTVGAVAALVSWPLLGGPLTAARLGAGALVAVGVGLLVGVRRQGVVRPPPVAASWRVAVTDLVDHTLPWVVVGLVLAAVAEAMLPPGALAGLSAGADVALAVLLALPVYLCGVGVVPLAAVLLHKGASAGAVTALLIAGPAAGPATWRTLVRLHGQAATLRVMAAVAVGSFAAGILVNAGAGVSTPDLHATLELPPSPVGVVAALLLGGALVLSLARRGADGFLAAVTGAHEHACGHADCEDPACEAADCGDPACHDHAPVVIGVAWTAPVGARRG